MQIVLDLEEALRSSELFDGAEFRKHLLPAAIIGYFPEWLLKTCEVTLRPLFEELASRCTRVWVERIAIHYQCDPKPLKDLWRLADDDREARVLKEIRGHADRILAKALLRKCLIEDYLRADTLYAEDLAKVLSEDEYTTIKRSFVRSWLKEHLPVPPSQFPDDEQIAAIAAATGTIHVTARAGSGKTTTLVRRTFFLMRHCRVSPDEILLLAFNRAAVLAIRREVLKILCPLAEATIASEIRAVAGSFRKPIDREVAAVDRAAEAHDVSLPRVMTFHGLAYGLVNPEQSLLVDSTDNAEQGLSRALQEVIDDHLRIPQWQSEIRTLMLLHFRNDWARIEGGGFDKERSELIEYRRLLPRETLRGEYVKSYGEKVIADFLLEHGVPYRYERNHRWGGFNYRPDFTLFRQAGKDASGVIIEYFGLAGDPDYDEAAARKRTYWASKSNWDFLEFAPVNVAANGLEDFQARLKDSLVALGFPCIRLTEDEIWALVKNRAIDRFTRAVGAFIGRCRKQLVSPQDLASRSERHESVTEAEERFIHVAQQLYGAYLDALAMDDKEDFDGVLQRAIATIQAGNTLVRRGQKVTCDLSCIRFVAVDEFQDFSELFYRLVTAIRHLKVDAHCFCVGDDWQAINGFAGSDLKYFRRFSEYMGRSTKLAISTNYRSSRAIVDAGNAIMANQGVPARVRPGSPQGSIMVASMDDFDASLQEQMRHQGDDITPAVLRVVGRSISEGRHVVMLCRSNSIPWYVNWENASTTSSDRLQNFLGLVQSSLPEEHRSRVTISTTHKYKGLEKDDVIIIDAVRRSYPLLHPDWVFSRILGVTIEQLVAEEQRLFYVAVTRAKSSVILFSEKRGESPFLTELKGKVAPRHLTWADYAPVSLVSDQLLIRLANRPGCRVPIKSGGFDQPTYAIREAIKLSGYRFRSGQEKTWEKSIPSQAFDIEQIKAELWVGDASGVDVVVLDGANHVVGKWSADAGELISVIQSKTS